ncbi:MAG TPA: aminotransferase class I/II-fold pyridoxal phosphate-dependent enzyme [Acidimicrobiia bacterium]|nr:aminotransferase class I/II-fold pyridoxal phosphate-dependent enzyme [Acidimicrobiia bacterium]
MSVADRLAAFGVTIFSEMTALALEHDAINLGQGFPNWDGADFVKEAARRSMEEGGSDQYPPSQGVPALREAIADRYGPLLGRTLDPATEITVTCGCTEALAASFLGLVDPGDEVILIEPFYDAYPVFVSMTGAVPRFVILRPPSFALDLDELRTAFSAKTRAIVVNNPHNPTGRVFTDEELTVIAALCVRYDVIAITDEVYEEMTYESVHRRLATYEGMWDRTLTLSSIGKTFSLTGWKLGWGIAPAALTAGLRSAHQFLTFTTPTPVQHGAVAAMAAPGSFYEDLRSGYLKKRDLLADGLEAVGFEVHLPQGTYFMMAGFDRFGFSDDRIFCRHLVEQARVVAIPPSVFYHRPEDGSSLVRFAFCKDEALLTEALDRLAALGG